MASDGPTMLDASQSPLRTAPAAGPAHIVLVEDDAQISGMLAETLRDNGFLASAVGSASVMDRLLETNQAYVFVLDVMLPGEDGLSICKRLRAASGVPIIMLTALGDDIDRIIGLEIGADDYVTKPFNSRELIARIRALLRRARNAGATVRGRTRCLRFAGWRLYPAERQLCNPEGARVTTTSAEFDLLLALCQNAGRILSREQLLDLTHGGLAGPIERSVDVHISRIRQKIEPDPRDPTLIKTVRLGGYIFTPDVEAS